MFFATASSLVVADAAWAAFQPAESSTARRPPSGKQVLAYGNEELQTLDYWPGTRAGTPLVVFVHGGGWKRGDKSMMEGSAKLTDWQAKGYAVASLNYRLVPDATVEQQAEDVASALAYLKGRAAQLGFDSYRIALVGHSAGAHLVALVGTDPQYLRRAGLDMDAVRGIVPLDGAAYYVPDQMEENALLLGATYKQAFGTDPKRQVALSPTAHTTAPNAPAFLILHVQRKGGIAQSQGLGDALRKAGTPVTVQGFPGRGLRGHAEINRKLGEADYPATPVVDAFLAKVFS
ncbi:alpha/beta hydrolase fold domain-containing protein [Altererythrobacter salegens]|uniref:Alpha/beta hydrolase fold domain-containing protein n=2 Tax=Croceibacterium salegens TaxID=1737568 RepID=A0A6I4SX44_9SPHN|nr:alpha/beta hydrolase fold domain-containing protein [Croceibacterium salegens]